MDLQQRDRAAGTSHQVASAESGPPVTSELLARVQDALATLEAESSQTSGAATGTATTALLRVTRDAVAALQAARSQQGEARIGRIQAYRSLIHRILEAAAKRTVRLAFHASPFRDEWTELLLVAATVSDYTVGPLFLSRARALGDRTLFFLPPSSEEERISWNVAYERVQRIGKALLAHKRQGHLEPVGILGANSAELALFDIACLVLGIPNVPIPANSQPGQAGFIAQHAGIQALFLGDDAAAEIALQADLPDALKLCWLSETRAGEGRIDGLSSFLDAGLHVTDDEFRLAAHRVRSQDLATTMYTSGTTGQPKGVPFTQANLVTKRFARAAAWPHLGEGDRFVCYLPLYHTFGRWLEMLGCVFWGAAYVFLEDVSVPSMLQTFQRYRPTTFISVPKKWIQLAEAAAPLHDDGEEAAHEEEISRRLIEVTGGGLRRGLSAAGYLPPTVFRRFHAAGIELHSGFGMTEATGGITMTPKGQYRSDSIGKALPGIELEIADDGELLIRGHYVTPPAEDDPPRPDDWFATGDIVTEDEEGHLRIVDRKKEIFKNIQGETISPRRIESLFAEFDVVERVLLIGDELDYCTVLIVPTAELLEEYRDHASGLTIDSTELRELFAPIVTTVNRFLAPFERIVDFAILSRDLDAERGELTAKGTPKRKLVRERLDDAIRPLYSREEETFEVGDVTVRIPVWFFRQSGVLASQVRVTDDALEITGTDKRLTISRENDGHVRVGDVVYSETEGRLLLGQISGRAELWLGNHALKEFVGSGIERWWRRGRRFHVPTRLVRRVVDSDVDLTPHPGDELDLVAVHELARLLASSDASVRRKALRSLQVRAQDSAPEMSELAFHVVRTGLVDRETRAEALRCLLEGLAPEELDRLLREHLADPSFLDEADQERLADRPMRSDQLEVVVAAVRDRAHELSSKADSEFERLVQLLIGQGIQNGAHHLRVRSFLVSLAADTPSISTFLIERLDQLSTRFRDRLLPFDVAGDVTMSDTVCFDDSIEPPVRDQILRALSETRLLAESVELLGTDPNRQHWPLVANSLRVKFLGTGAKRTVYLLEWAPGGEGTPPAFECVLKINDGSEWSEIEREIRLQMRARAQESMRPVVKTQGGAYAEHGIWTEEFVPGESLARLVRRLVDTDVARGSSGSERIGELWQFLISSSAALLVDFWNRTGRHVTLRDPDPTKIVLPEHDWQIGRRLVSVANLAPATRLLDVLEATHVGVVQRLREEFPVLARTVDYPVLFSAALEILGEEEGIRILDDEADQERDAIAAGDPTSTTRAELVAAAARFVSSTRRRGFLPARIRIAARRYRRWSQLNPHATWEAQASTLDQLEAAYGLDDLDLERPGTRLQFYRHSVFRRADINLTRGLDEVIGATLESKPTRAEWHRAVTSLRENLKSSDEQEFFLARMLYPHLDPRGRARLVHEEDSSEGFATGVVVEHRDSSGRIFRIRRPANPNDVTALLREFRRAGFRRVPSGEHVDFLVATDESERVVGGIVFDRQSETYVRLAWIVVSRHRQGSGLGSALVRDFLDRLTAQGVQVVATGFFRPAFFANFGFGVDPRYAGIIRTLKPTSGIVPRETTS